MLPFFSSLPNQIQPQPHSSSSGGVGGGNNPSLHGQQTMLLNPMSLFPPPTTPTAASFNNYQPGAIGFPPMPAPLQNNNNNNNPMGILQPQLGLNPAAAAAALQLQLQVQLHNAAQVHAQLQSLTALASLQSPAHPAGAFLGAGLPHGFNPVGLVMPNRPVHMQPPAGQGNQTGHPGFPPFATTKYPQLVAPGNSGNNAMFRKESSLNMFGHGAKHNGVQSLISGSPMGNQYDAMHREHGQQRPQFYKISSKPHGSKTSLARMSNLEDGGGDVSRSISDNSTYRGFQRNHHGYDKGVNTRMQRTQFQHSKYPRAFMRTGEKGTKHWTDRKAQFVKCSKPPLPEVKRLFAVNYSENEIRQWIEARKRNYPTRANIEKKMVGITSSRESANDDAKLRRKQLKEVLTKQAELGVEVAEIPSGYLSESESLKNNDVYSNKRGRYGKENQHAKKPNLRNGPPPALPVKQREPTLLQKLLKADIKGDRNRILQVFRFMRLNSFFKNCPDKPLEFPSVTLRETVCENGTAVDEIQDKSDVVNLGLEKRAAIDETETSNGFCVVDRDGSQKDTTVEGEVLVEKPGEGKLPGERN